MDIIIALESKEGEVFLLTETVARQSQLLRQIIDGPDLRADFQTSIYLHNVTTPILAKVIEYCTRHVRPANYALAFLVELRNWDEQFVDVDQAMLCDLTVAAYLLQIEGLEHLLFMKVVNIINANRLEEYWQFLMKWSEENGRR